jgi:hypothetical protein
MVSSSNPTVLMQYPRLRKCSPVTRLFSRIRRWIRTLLFPLRNPIAKAKLYFGAMLRHMCIWSGMRSPSTSTTPRCWQTSRITSSACFRSFPYRFPLRYFGIFTTWYLQSHRTWDKLCQLCIGSSSSSFLGTFPREEPILFLAGSVEPIQVLHPRWRV